MFVRERPPTNTTATLVPHDFHDQTLDLSVKHWARDALGQTGSVRASTMARNRWSFRFCSSGNSA